MSDMARVYLKEHTGQVVEATLIREMTIEDVTEVYDAWRELIEERRREDCQVPLRQRKEVQEMLWHVVPQVADTAGPRTYRRRFR